MTKTIPPKAQFGEKKPIKPAKTHIIGHRLDVFTYVTMWFKQKTLIENSALGKQIGTGLLRQNISMR